MLGKLTAMTEPLALRALHCLDPELAHHLAIRALAMGMGPRHATPQGPRLATRIAGLTLPHPIGLAAGLDKNAEAIPALLNAGFGFVEVGAITPRPQAGNPRPRLFRLSEDRAVINRFGFNNLGQQVAARNLARPRPKGVVGLNIGANKETVAADNAQTALGAVMLTDYQAVLRACWGLADFYTINVSSPNTAGLRAGQGRQQLETILAGVLATRDELVAQTGMSGRIFLKIAPDLDPAQVSDVAEVALAYRVDAVIATNTTLARPEGLRSRHAAETGGLSGAPLFDRSTAILRDLARATAGRMPLIGVGGIATAEQVLTKIRNGASAVQLYSALVYDGIGLAARLAQELDQLLAGSSVQAEIGRAL